jgi:acetyl-CoA C-acetyltransferase
MRRAAIVAPVRTPIGAFGGAIKALSAEDLATTVGRPQRRPAVEVPGLQIDRRCGGGLQAVITAAMMVQTGAADVVVAGGVESMSNIEHYATGVKWGSRHHAS